MIKPVLVWIDESAEVNLSAWAQLTPKQVLEDIRALFELENSKQFIKEWPNIDNESFARIIAVEHTPLAEPKALAHNRAVNILGPKKGRWK